MEGAQDRRPPLEQKERWTQKPEMPPDPSMGSALARAHAQVRSHSGPVSSHVQWRSQRRRLQGPFLQAALPSSVCTPQATGTGKTCSCMKGRLILFPEGLAFSLSPVPYRTLRDQMLKPTRKPISYRSLQVTADDVWASPLQALLTNTYPYMRTYMDCKGRIPTGTQFGNACIFTKLT